MLEKHNPEHYTVIIAMQKICKTKAKIKCVEYITDPKLLT